MRSLTLHRDLLLGLTGLLLLIGLVLLASASTVAGFQRFQDPYFYFKHQLLFGVLPGIIAFLIVKKIGTRMWQGIAPVLYIMSLALLTLVLLPQVRGIGSTKSWIIIGSFSFQPSEIAKFSLILMLAWWASRRNLSVIGGFRGFGEFLMIFLPVAVLLLLQPDVGTLVIISGIALSVYFLSGGSLVSIAFLLLVGLGGIIAVSIRSPYRLARLLVFLNKDVDPQGVGYHTRQALLAIGSGGLWGRGLGHSIQKFQYLPEVQSDSLFAVAAEELGFVLTATLFIVLLIFWRTLYTLSLAVEDRFCRIAIGGVLSWFIIQTFLNIGAMLGLLPLTGVPLPLLSYGGTALAIELAAVGFVMAVTSKQQSVNSK